MCCLIVLLVIAIIQSLISYGVVYFLSAGSVAEYAKSLIMFHYVRTGTLFEKPPKSCTVKISIAEMAGGAKRHDSLS